MVSQSNHEAVLTGHVCGPVTPSGYLLYKDFGDTALDAPMLRSFNRGAQFCCSFGIIHVVPFGGSARASDEKSTIAIPLDQHPPVDFGQALSWLKVHYFNGHHLLRALYFPNLLRSAFPSIAPICGPSFG